MKKYIYLILFVFAFSTNAIQAQSKDPVKYPRAYDKITKLDNGLIQLERNAQKALLDAHGKLLVPFGKYDKSCNFLFYDGYAPVYIKLKQEKVTNCATERKSKQLEKVACGIIDTLGQEIVPLTYDQAGFFSDGFAPVLKGNLQNKPKCGFVNKQGKLVVGLIYDCQVSTNDELLTFWTPPKFKYGKAIVSKNRKYGVIDSTGGVVIPFEYDFIAQNKQHFFVGRQGSKFMIFDKQNHPHSISKEYDVLDDEIDFQGNELLSSQVWDNDEDGNFTILNKQKKLGYMNRYGKVIIPCRYDEIWTSSDNPKVLRVRKNNKFGFFDNQGKQLTKINLDQIEPITQYIEDSWDDITLRFIRSGNKIGLVDSCYHEIIPPEFDKIMTNQKTITIKDSVLNDNVNEDTGYDRNSFLFTIKGDKGAFFNLEKKNIKTPFKYDTVPPNFIKWGVIARQKRKWGMIDNHAKKLVPFIYDSIQVSDNNNFFDITLDKKHGIINQYGKIIISPKYDFCTLDFTGSLIPIKNNQKWGVADTLGHIVLPCSYDSISAYQYNGICKNKKWAILDEKSKSQNFSFRYDELSNYKYLLSYYCVYEYIFVHLFDNKLFMRFITLTEEEKSKVTTLYKTSPNSVVRTRCLSLLYSNEQRSIKEVSTLVGLSRRSLERLFNVWESSKDKYATLSIKTGRGAKLKLLPIKDLLPDLIKEHSRNLNPILEELYQKHHIRVCKLTLQNFLKDYGL